ncbi:hypothetical protein CI102_981 [Trichoderma harzianum]|nr:hypothetical protein CI102_981 [Trichoderma harzianum]
MHSFKKLCAFLPLYFLLILQALVILLGNIPEDEETSIVSQRLQSRQSICSKNDTTTIT